VPCVLYISLISSPLKREDACGCDAGIILLFLTCLALNHKGVGHHPHGNCFHSHTSVKTPTGQKISCHIELFLLQTAAIWLGEKREVVNSGIFHR